MRYRVLLAGDNIRSLTVLRKLLEIFTHEFVVNTSSGIKDLHIDSTSDLPDIIILNFDNTMKEGIKALEIIKKNAHSCNIPVLMATEFVSSEVQQAIVAGADDFISKPIERVELFIRIKYLIQRKQLHTENLKKSTELRLAKERLLDQNQDLIDLTVNLEKINMKLEEQQQEVSKQKKMVEEQKKMADDLLLNIFPYEIAEQLKNKGRAKPMHYRLVSIMFTDFAGFSKLSDHMNIQDLIKELSMYFENFDIITGAHYIEKIKTIGDSYMCAGGLPIRNRSNPVDTVLAALKIQKFVIDSNKGREKNLEQKWEIRLGIHTGEVIAGVIGKRKMAYDIWGDAVNTASRMESCGEVNRINISGGTYRHVKKYFDCTYRGKIEVRNMGLIDMYFVEGLKQEYRADSICVVPNNEFKRLLAEL
jgi:class 3 adenylate cyclase/AmiR/NasT family two-component response regulator